MRSLGPIDDDLDFATKKYVDDLAGGHPSWFAPPLASLFTLSNSGGISNLTLVDDSDIGLVVKNPSFSAGGLMAAIATVATPAGVDWSATARMSGTTFSGEYFGIGMVVLNAAGKLFTHGARRYSSTTGLMANAWNSLSSFNSDFLRWDGINLAEMPWRRIEYVAATTTLKFSAGLSGKDWTLLASDSAFVGAPNRVGLYMGAGGGGITGASQGIMVVDHWDTSF